ncbi:alpha/beta fold hydrolase [Patescibacteria group bacterium]|nr:MAG: alpha/beta fold hydrolase [Patescibacteria group bacterium]
MTERVKKILRSIGSILRSDPQKLFRFERHLVNQPFFFQGTNGRAVILAHGWSSTPYEVRRLGKYLNENGYTVSGPMLRGHGTVPKDLEGVKWQDWLNDLDAEYERLHATHDKIYLAGTSIGSSLSLLLAQRKPEIGALVLMATPFHIRFERQVIWILRATRFFKKYRRKFYPPTFGSARTITRLISYQTYPIDSVLEIYPLIEEVRHILPQIKAPCLIIQSSSDHIVSRGSLEKIYAQIGSVTKQKRYIHRAYHTFISDIKNEHVFEDILNFLNEN